MGEAGEGAGDHRGLITADGSPRFGRRAVAALVRQRAFDAAVAAGFADEIGVVWSSAARRPKTS